MAYFDNIIIGAGPAGLQMAYYLDQAGRSYAVLEAGQDAGTFFKRFPRHRTLLSINKRFNYFSSPEFNLRHDWNSLLSDDGPRFTAYSEQLYPDADELARYLNDFAGHFDLNIDYDTVVQGIRKTEGGSFALSDQRGREYGAARVFLATGAVGPYVPSHIRNIELAEGYEDHSLDVASYRDQRVAIIGGGNSAFEVAQHIAGHAAIVHILVRRPVKHAWNTHYPGDLRAINNTIVDMYQLKSLHATLGFDVREIIALPEGGVRLAVREHLPDWDPPAVLTRTLDYDRVIRCTGWRYADDSLFTGSSVPRLDASGRFFELDSTWQTTVPGLYCIGTAMQYRDRKAASSFIHGFRYNIRTLFRLLEQHYGAAYPRLSVPLADDDDLARAADVLLRRLSVTSALFQQFGFLCDLIVYADDQLRVFPELPIAHVMEQQDFLQSQDAVLMSLEFGFDRYPARSQPIDFIHAADPTHSECSAFLHPVFRHYRFGELVAEVHLAESSDVRYDYEPIHGVSNLGHKNRTKNFLNSVAHISPVTFPEGIYEDRLDGLGRQISRQVDAAP